MFHLPLLRGVFLSLMLVGTACGFQAQPEGDSAPARDVGFDRSQVFDEVVETVAKHFYPRHFDQATWRATAEQRRPAAVAAANHDQFAEIINQLLAGLKTSHTYYYSKQDPRRYQLLGIFHSLYPDGPADLFVHDGIGVGTQKQKLGHRVHAVYDGFPAQAAGIRFGDVLLEYNGKPFHPIESFRDEAGNSGTLKVMRNGQPLDVAVDVVSLDGRTMFETAMKESFQVFERNGKRIGYAHAWSYAGQKYQDLLEEALLWGELSSCDSLVLDLRDGWGGASVNYLNLFRAPIIQVRSLPRDGPEGSYAGVWGKPVALLTNGRSTSGKELFAFGFKKLKLGRIFGATTAGAVVAGRAFLLGNGDVLYLAVADVEVDGERLEGKGVVPDVQVTRPWDEAGEADPQLAAALEYLQAQPAASQSPGRRPN